MSKRLGVVVSAAGVLALVMIMIVPAMAGNGDDTVTLLLAEKFADDEHSVTEIDAPPQGVSAGDYFVFGHDPLYNRSLTKRLGHIDGECFLVDVNPAGSAGTYECNVSFYLPGGLLTTRGAISFAGEDVEILDHAITGGTGKYKTAHGVEKAELGPEGVLYTFRIIL